MLPSKTVFVIGAGASSEVGLPVGARLKEIIADKLDLRFKHHQEPIGNGDLAILEVLRRTFQNQINPYIEACWRIRDGLALSSSIDDYIDAHQHDKLVELCGKIAIARSILEAERDSHLYFKKTHIDDSINFQAVGNTWYVGFYQLISQGVTKKHLDLLFSNVTLVIFNYDRCIEHFLAHAIAQNYHTSIHEARELVKQLVIYRPYGSVGAYFGAAADVVEFGNTTQNIKLDKIIATLRTYTEQIEDSKSLNAIREAIFEASVLVFLGNAFHPTNMKLLTVQKNDQVHKRFYFTRKGISDNDLNVVRATLSAISPGLTPTFHQANECRDLFSDYRMSLRT